MDENIKKIYMHLAKYKKSPMDTFQDWNRVKMVANMECKDLPWDKKLYPEYVRMIMRYRR